MTFKNAIAAVALMITASACGQNKPNEVNLPKEDLFTVETVVEGINNPWEWYSYQMGVCWCLIRKGRS